MASRAVFEGLVALLRMCVGTFEVASSKVMAPQLGGHVELGRRRADRRGSLCSHALLHPESERPARRSMLELNYACRVLIGNNNLHAICQESSWPCHVQWPQHGQVSPVHSKYVSRHQLCSHARQLTSSPNELAHLEWWPSGLE